MPAQQKSCPGKLPNTTEKYVDNEKVDRNVAKKQHKENNSMTEQQKTCLSLVSVTAGGLVVPTDQHVNNANVDRNVAKKQHKENNSMTEQQEPCLSLVQTPEDLPPVKIYFHSRHYGYVQARNIHSRIFDN